MLCQELYMAEIEMLWFSCIKVWGVCVISESFIRIFCNGWMDFRDAFHAVLCLLLYNGLSTMG